MVDTENEPQRGGFLANASIYLTQFDIRPAGADPCFSVMQTRVPVDRIFVKSIPVGTESLQNETRVHRSPGNIKIFPFSKYHLL